MEFYFGYTLKNLGIQVFVWVAIKLIVFYSKTTFQLCFTAMINTIIMGIRR